MSLLKTFILNVKTERIRQGLSQEQLAEKSELHRTYISFLERGKRNLTLNTVEKLANALDIDPILLFKTYKEEKDV